MTFEIMDMDSAYAHTTYKNDGSVYYIRFNTDYIDEDGWNGPTQRTDRIGYDWNNVHTKEEAMLVTLTHEAMHANHFARYNDALIKCNGIVAETREYLLENGYSQEFVNIFIEQDGDGKYVETKDYGDRMHEYMKAYDLKYIDEALAEYRNDFKN